MTVAVKICGLTTPAAIAVAAREGARFVGFVFYPRSPRNLSPGQALALAGHVPPGLCKVGVFVDPGDEALAAARPALDMVQLHGSESPARVAEIGRRFALPVMKVIKVAGEDDPAVARDYVEVADWLMFDAKPPKGVAGTLPGGNALAFDWRLLAGSRAKSAAGGRPWMLSGGLTPDNVAEAIAVTDAEAVDVSSGVEDEPGVKSLARIAAFLAAVRGAPYGAPAGTAEEGASR